MKPLVAVVAAIVFAAPLHAGDSANPCSYLELFGRGEVGCPPQGPMRGIVLWSDGAHPHLKARTQGTLWKGKEFHCDGSFTNRWLGGIHAGGATISVESSWRDGQPCFVMQYGPDARVFANVRDEIRQIAPDLWLGCSLDAPSGQLKNWFLLRGQR
jgi:hypothetical protein